MVYGAEAVLPSDIRHDSPHVAAYVEADNEKARQDAIDMLDDGRALGGLFGNLPARSAPLPQPPG